MVNGVNCLLSTSHLNSVVCVEIQGTLKSELWNHAPPTHLGLRNQIGTFFFVHEKRCPARVPYDVPNVTHSVLLQALQ